jgi:pimeloyl-ACP methyl ester carboxylesterase
MNGSVLLELAHLTPGQRVLRSAAGPLFARLMTGRGFRLQMRRLSPKPISDAELEVMWWLLARDDGALQMPAIIGYLDERVRFRSRWVGALARVDVPALVAWGRRDPVAVAAIAERLANIIPGARAHWWDDLGHYPQVESPARVADTVGTFWRDVDVAASR